MNSKIILILSAAAVLIALVVAGAIVLNTAQVNHAYKVQIELGDRYLSDGDYEEAVLCYSQALDIKPKGEEAALGLSEAYIQLGEYHKADAILRDIEFKDPSLAERLDALIKASELELTLTSVDTTNFPEVTLEFSREDSDLEITAQSFDVFEDGKHQDITSMTSDGGIITVSYWTTLPASGTEKRDVYIEFEILSLTLEARTTYETPVLDTATMSLVTTDTSNYPIVRAYYRIEDDGTGESVDSLTAASFVLNEKIGGADFLVREIRSVEQLEGHAGLNISLVADKSDSISDDDMWKIKNVMSGFVSNLEYTVGDMAELLAFDTEVTQMCIFTDTEQLLKNGITNMYTSGRTALYDALVTAVNHVRYQDGARCVIAFTDGLDNESINSAANVISYAQSYEIPIYIIGVSYDVDQNTLKNIASQTGGKYWFIDDLGELNEIYSTIYVEQKKMYVIEYETDPTADASAPREISVTFAGAGYKGVCDIEFTPKQSDVTVGSLQANASNELNTSRYELYLSNMSWEDAAEYCIAHGGHLVTINSTEEEALVESMANKAGVSYVWLGGYTAYDSYGNMFGHWVTGESFDYSNWHPGEPSKDDLDGTAERYIVMWFLQNYGQWTWNDTRNDPVAIGFYTDKLAFICEYEN